MSLFGSLRNRLLAGLALLLLLFLALVGAGIGSLRSVNAAVEGELSALARSAGLATMLVGAVSDEVRVGEAYLVVPSPQGARDFLRLSDSTHAFRRRFRLIPGLTAEDQSALNRIEANQASMEVAYATAHALRDLDSLAAARDQAGAARAPADSVVADVRRLTQRHQLRVSASIAQVARRARQREVVIWLLLLAAIVFGAGTAFITIRSVEVPLYQLITAARRLGEGDLRQLELGTMPRELATLARAMGSMGLKLRNVIDNLIRESRGIGVHASDLSAMSEELAAGSQEITHAIGAVTASAHRQVAEVKNADPVIGSWRDAAARDAATAERVVADGEQTRALASRHHQDLSGAARGLAGLRQSVRLAGTQTRQLTRRADVLEELLDLARQLVTQSEVLALNAAVEAARAGSQTQGFASVAEETRRLADASRAATERIAQGTEALRADISGLEATIQGLATEALQVESTTQRTVVALNEIARATEAMRTNAAEVSHSVASSRAIANRLADLRARLEADARENVAATEAVTSAASDQSTATGEIAGAAASLLEASERLAALVEDFRI